MTKSQLIAELTQRHPRFSRKEAEVRVNEVFEAMTDALGQGERIELRGFGSFSVKERAARQARNPQTGAMVSVAAKRLPVFRAAKELRWRINGQASSGQK
ncbi:MAG: HU family DNA-binding protein [Candidatus Tectomicrobia bacterium]